MPRAFAWSATKSGFNELDLDSSGTKVQALIFKEAKVWLFKHILPSTVDNQPQEPRALFHGVCGSKAKFAEECKQRASTIFHESEIVNTAPFFGPLLDTIPMDESEPCPHAIRS